MVEIWWSRPIEQINSRIIYLDYLLCYGFGPKALVFQSLDLFMEIKLKQKKHGAFWGMLQKDTVSDSLLGHQNSQHLILQAIWGDHEVQQGHL